MEPGSTDPATPEAPLELRVHGVSGTPPDALLDRKLVTRVDGDAIAGFYRPDLLAERFDAAPGPYGPVVGGPEPAPQLEGYAWGGLTSGSPGRAFWLTLLPFTLVNVAPRARPEDQDPLRTRLIWYVARALALSQTLLLILTFVGIGTDLIGWQCQDGPRCSGAQPHWVFDRILGRAAAGEPAQGLLIGALVPVLALVLLWFLSRKSVASYERVEARAPDGRMLHATDLPDDDAVEVGLSSPAMWRGEAQVRRLRSVHLQCGLALVLLILLLPAAGARKWLIVGPALVFAYALWALARPDYVGRRARKNLSRQVFAVWLFLGALTAVIVLGSLVDDHWLTHHAAGSRPRALPGYAGAFLWEVLVTLGLLFAFALLILWSSQAGRPEPAAHQSPLRRGLHGQGASVFAALGVLFGATFSAGLYTYAAAFLRTGSLAPRAHDVSDAFRAFSVPEVARVAMIAYVWAVAVFVVVLLGTVGYVLVLRARPLRPDPVPLDYPDADTDEDRARSIRRAVVMARFTDRVPAVLGILALAGSAITGYFGAGLAAENFADVVWPGIGVSHHGFWSATSLAGKGSYLTMLTMTGLITVGYAVFRTPATRRTVGMLWDIASFWPRSAHPLSAPCYAERTVPDLVTRLAGYRTVTPGRTVILSAHSQGTVIAAATLFQLEGYDPRLLDRVGYLSFGCPLRRLYSCYFPVYFGPARLEQLQQALGGEQPRWLNLWRRTDYIGAEVTTGPPPDDPDAQPWDRLVLDPPMFARAVGATAFTTISRHSDYWKDPSGSFQRAVADLVATVQVNRDTSG